MSGSAGDDDPRLLWLLIAPAVCTLQGVPVELDPTSEYCRARAWPEWMSREERVAAHAELFGAGTRSRSEGPPFHPDAALPAGSAMHAARATRRETDGETEVSEHEVHEVSEMMSEARVD